MPFHELPRIISLLFFTSSLGPRRITVMHVVTLTPVAELGGDSADALGTVARFVVSPA